MILNISIHPKLTLVFKRISDQNLNYFISICIDIFFVVQGSMQEAWWS